ncbi:MAG: hypothetical protein ACREHC_03885, partial [Candidatus Levyibacteriota bacterium]
MNKKDLTNTWEATQLRITLFPQESFSGNVIDLLPKIEGLVTNQITTQPQSLEQVIESTIDNYKLILTALPIKLDLVLIPGEGLEGQA